MRIGAYNAVSGKYQSLFRQEGMFNAHFADIEEIFNSVPLCKAPYNAALSGGRYILVRHKMVEHKGYSVRILRFQSPVFFKLLYGDRCGYIVTEYNVTLRLDKPPCRDRFQSGRMSKNFLRTGHSHFCYPYCRAVLPFSDAPQRLFITLSLYSIESTSALKLASIIFEETPTVVFQINRFSPYVTGLDTLVPLSAAQYLVRADVEKETIPGGVMEADPETAAMSQYILDEIPDGACLQIGIGGVANAVTYGLRTKNDLGCHTEMMSDALMVLMQEGVINNSRPKFIPHRSVVGFAFGSKALYEFLDHNEKMYFGPFPVVNHPANIAQNENMISINTAMSIDLFGQVAAEGIGPHQFSGTGGQGDYIRGAQMSKGGKSFLAFKSTVGQNPDGSLKSRIVPYFPPATIVTTPRSDVQYVVTEQGVVNLKPLTTRDRARALIDLAHPDCRPELVEAAKKLGIF